MLERLYKKSELGFALVWIAIYVVGVSTVQSQAAHSSMPNAVLFITTLCLTVIVASWLIRHKRTAFYGLRKPCVPAKRCLYYLPLILLLSCNLWGGLHVSLSLSEALCYVGHMLCVGFLEEVIFRGFLFRAMAKTNLRAAMIVSSVTFGIGHLVNLVNGSGADLLSNLLQVAYAMAAGFLFTYLYYKTESLWACIITHSVLNALSVFAPPEPTPVFEIVSAVLLCLLSLCYLAYLVMAFRTKQAS